MRGSATSIIAGHLGQDIDLKYTGNGTAVANVSIATKSTYKDQKTTHWHRVTLFGKLAETASQYLGKGSAVMFHCRIENRRFEHKGQEREVTEHIAEKMDFLSGEKPKDQPKDYPQGSDQPKQPGFDDIPF